MQKIAIVTNDFPLYGVYYNKYKFSFFAIYNTTKKFIKFAQSCSSRTTNRQRIDVDIFLEQKVSLNTDSLYIFVL